LEIHYPAELPITGRKDEILDALRTSQVVVVAGETGSGKSTQLPKFCLELGRGDVAATGKRIGHTQPRRIAARSVAERVADELGDSVGGVVGYAVRFTDHVGDGTRVKVMTDGILLAEIQRDRNLNRYDTLIIDEAHERSLNVDFILGYLKQLLPRRPDLKVVITSATIDTERFSRHFDDAPVIEVSGRTYPVEVRYRPVADGDDGDPVVRAVEELSREGPGDILVFFSGEREIRDAADAITARRLPDTEVLPLYARLSAAEQHRVFARHPGRRIVLATNVAETSLTVPGVRYVVDTGTARISRFNRRTKVQRLPIEAVSQASANQRAGRCGRLGPGVCIRLYAEDDYLARPEFTDPEILRTNLASVILQMAAIGLGDVAAFPFVDPPDARAINDGVALLEELGALSSAGGLTKLGRRLAALPLDPRLGRMVLAAADNGCVREVIVIAAALSIQDPRERPLESRAEADEKHARFADGDSDFLGLLNLWQYLRERQKSMSSSQFRKLCRSDYLNYLRVREWQDLFSQLRQISSGLGLHVSAATDAVDRDGIHRSLLAGLVSHVGMKDVERQEYLGARNARFALAPGSALFRKAPKWVMAAELVETTRLWARVAARVQPEWIEAAAAHLVKRSYSDPWWDASRGAAMALEKVTLYGIPLVTGRRVPFGPIDPSWSRDLFIRHGLVEGDWPGGAHHRFVADNKLLVEDVQALEDRWRRRDLLVSEEALFAWFDARVPSDVVSGRHFDSWWKQASRSTPTLLHLSWADAVDAEVGDPAVAFPDAWIQGSLSLPVSYLFEPGSSDDGVVVHVPLSVLNQVSPAGFDWHVPGLRLELVTALLRSLPKVVRRSFVPALEYATAFLAAVGPGDGPLVESLQRYLTSSTGVVIPRGAWDVAGLPTHLRLRFSVEEADGSVVAVGPDLAALQDRLRPDMRAALSGAAATGDGGSTSWTFGTLARVVEDGSVRAYPALVDGGSSVSVRMFESAAAQARSMASGTRRLLLLTLPAPAPVLGRLLDNRTKLAIATSPYASPSALIDDAVVAAVDSLVGAYGGPAWDEDSFAELRGAVGGSVVDVALEAVRQAGALLSAWRSIEDRLSGLALSGVVADVRSQLARLFDGSFVSTIGVDRLGDVARYLTAIERRLDKLPAEAARDASRMAVVQGLEDAYDDLVATAPLSGPEPELVEVRWMIEELRVSLFAQTLGTPYRVSEERIRKAMATIGG
jgi:ATP-dependent helicase HrpA